MKKDLFATQKQSGKVTTQQVAVVANASKSVALKHRDSEYYQVAAHGDYVQEKN